MLVLSHFTRRFADLGRGSWGGGGRGAPSFQRPLLMMGTLHPVPSNPPNAQRPPGATPSPHLITSKHCPATGSQTVTRYWSFCTGDGGGRHHPPPPHAQACLCPNMATLCFRTFWDLLEPWFLPSQSEEIVVCGVVQVGGVVKWTAYPRGTIQRGWGTTDIPENPNGGKGTVTFRLQSYSEGRILNFSCAFAGWTRWYYWCIAVYLTLLASEALHRTLYHAEHLSFSQFQPSMLVILTRTQLVLLSISHLWGAVLCLPRLCLLQRGWGTCCVPLVPLVLKGAQPCASNTTGRTALLVAPPMQIGTEVVSVLIAVSPSEAMFVVASAQRAQCRLSSGVHWWFSAVFHLLPTMSKTP